MFQIITRIYKVPCTLYFSTLCRVLMDPTLKRKFLKRITLTDAIMAEMSSSNCPKKFLECCYNKQANLCLWVFKLSGLKSVFKKAPFSCRISVDGRPNRRKKAAFSNSSGLKSVFVKLRFRDGLVWTVGLAVEIKLRF